jgi:hypothetical protein
LHFNECHFTDCSAAILVNLFGVLDGNRVGDVIGGSGYGQNESIVTKSSKKILIRAKFKKKI